MAAITNNQIIFNYKLMNNINSELHTFEGWKALGYSVKKGEHAEHKFSIWKHATKKNKETGEETSSCFLKLSAFFTAEQVEPITA